MWIKKAIIKSIVMVSQEDNMNFSFSYVQNKTNKQPLTSEQMENSNNPEGVAIKNCIICRVVHITL